VRNQERGRVSLSKSHGIQSVGARCVTQTKGRRNRLLCGS